MPLKRQKPKIGTFFLTPLEPFTMLNTTKYNSKCAVAISRHRRQNNLVAVVAYSLPCSVALHGLQHFNNGPFIMRQLVAPMLKGVAKMSSAFRRIKKHVTGGSERQSAGSAVRPRMKTATIFPSANATSMPSSGEGAGPWSSWCIREGKR